MLYWGNARTGNDIGGHYKRHYFPLSVVYSSHRRSARIKKTYSQVKIIHQHIHRLKFPKYSKVPYISTLAEIVVDWKTKSYLRDL